MKIKYIKYSDWEKHVTSISKELGGQLNILKRPSGGAFQEYLISNISINYKNEIISIEQLFIKGDYENGVPKKLNLYYKFDNQFDFFLSINQRDLFDKILGWNRIRLEDSEFDKKFTIQSNDRQLAQKIFNNADLRNLLLSDKSLILNITTKNHQTEIQIKNMVHKFYSLEEYLIYIKSLKSIIDKIKN